MATATRQCRHCKQRKRREDMKITPNNAAFCDHECASQYGKKNIAVTRKKEAKRQKREFYAKDIKTRREAAVFWFNRFIRLRDSRRGCISCGTEKPELAYHAGHFVNAGSCSALRFDERNVWKQCARCNVFLSGNKGNYRVAICEELGEVVVAELEGPQPTVKITAEWYKSIEDKYKAKCKELEKEAA